MACRLFRAKPLFEVLNQSWNIVNWTLKNKIQSNPNGNLYILIQENRFENVVCERRPFCLSINVLSRHILIFLPLILDVAYPNVADLQLA